MSPKPLNNLMPILGLAEFISALLLISAPYSGDSAGVVILPGALFGATLSVTLWWRKVLRPFWKILAITVASSLAFIVSGLLAMYLELFSPYPLHEIGKGFSSISGTALFVGGMLAAFLILSAVLRLVDSAAPWNKILNMALIWSPIGGVLGIAGWNLGPWLGRVFWSLQHDLGRTPAGDKFEYALARGWAAELSLLVVWMTGTGLLLGLALGNLRFTKLEDSRHE